MLRLVLLAAMGSALLCDAWRSEKLTEQNASLKPGDPKTLGAPQRLFVRKPPFAKEQVKKRAYDLAPLTTNQANQVASTRLAKPSRGGQVQQKIDRPNQAGPRPVGPKFEKYDLVDPEPVGKGSFGMVYKATDKTNPNSTIALKVPNDGADSTSMAGDCGKMQALEQRIKGQSGNGHVIRCLENGEGYIALEWAGTQGDKAIRGKPLVQILKYFKQLMLALRALLAANPTFVHHDLKWDNVAIADDQCLRVIDLDAGIDGACQFQHQNVDTFPATAPPEWNVESNSPTFQCGLDCAQVRQSKECPLAYTWDMYTAGAMAVEMCGLDWLAAVRHIDSNNDTDKFDDLVEETDELNRPENNPEEELHKLGLYIFLGTDRKRLNPNSWTSVLVGDGEPERHSFVEDLKDRFGEKEKALLQQWGIDDSQVQAMVARVEGCARLGEDVLQKFDEMIDADPQLRPQPQDVLNVLSNEGTGCKLDAA